MPVTLYKRFSSQGAHHKLLSIDTLQCKAAIEKALNQACHVSMGSMELLWGKWGVFSLQNIHFAHHAKLASIGCSRRVYMGAAGLQEQVRRRDVRSLATSSMAMLHAV